MNEIERAIKHFENMRDENFVVLDSFRKEIEDGKVSGSTLLYDNRHLYYSLAIAALREQAEREKGCVWCKENNKVFHDGQHFNMFCSYCGKRLEVEQDA